MGKDKNFWISLTIVLATICIGLISYLFYSARLNATKESPKCEYNGWAYSDGDWFDSTDGCNQCICDDGFVSCTEIACE